MPSRAGLVKKRGDRSRATNRWIGTALIYGRRTTPLQTCGRGALISPRSELIQQGFGVFQIIGVVICSNINVC
jgi:hypothetical protein